jgi:hypothetical protein
MNTITINIGLNINNIEPKEQEEITTHNLINLFYLAMYNTRIIEGGEWQGIKERTVISCFDIGDLKPFAIKLLLSWLCTELNQDAIAFKLNGEGYMAFNPLYTGEQFEFSEEMFQNF